MAANEVLARVAERRVLRPAGFHRSYRQRLFVGHDLGKSSGSAGLPRAELGINGLKARAATRYGVPGTPSTRWVISFYQWSANQLTLYPLQEAKR